VPQSTLAQIRPSCRVIGTESAEALDIVKMQADTARIY